MNGVDAVSARIARWLRERAGRAIDGEHEWGSVAIAENPRAQWVRYTVTVYPPGTSLFERRTMQAHRNWLLFGSLFLSMAALALSVYWPPVLVVAASAAVFLAGVWTTSRATSQLRARSIRLQAGFVDYGGRRESLGEATDVKRTLETFRDLDRRRAAGELSPAEYELYWAMHYDDLLRTHPAKQTARAQRITSAS